jgi:hypothetical protein
MTSECTGGDCAISDREEDASDLSTQSVVLADSPEQNSPSCLGASENFNVPTPREFKSELVLGGSLVQVGGERVAPEKDLKLSRRGTDLQVYRHS